MPSEHPTPETTSGASADRGQLPWSVARAEQAASLRERYDGMSFDALADAIARERAAVAVLEHTLAGERAELVTLATLGEELRKRSAADPDAQRQLDTLTEYVVATEEYADAIVRNLRSIGSTIDDLVARYRRRSPPAS